MVNPPHDRETSDSSSQSSNTQTQSEGAGALTDSPFTIDRQHGVDFAGTKLWYLGRPSQSVPLADVPPEIHAAVMSHEKAIGDFVLKEQHPEAICLHMKKTRRGLTWAQSKNYCYYACDGCRQKKVPCIRQTDDGFTVRPWYGEDSMKWAVPLLHRAEPTGKQSVAWRDT
jgi:hypothetical protein